MWLTTGLVLAGTVNGKPTHGDKALLDDLLRGVMHWNGYLISDYNDIQGLVQRGAASNFEDVLAALFGWLKELTRVGLVGGLVARLC